MRPTLRSSGGACRAKGAQTQKAIGEASTEGVGGAYRDRTDDPLLAKQVLSQLS